MDELQIVSEELQIVSEELEEMKDVVDELVRCVEQGGDIIRDEDEADMPKTLKLLRSADWVKRMADKQRGTN